MREKHQETAATLGGQEHAYTLYDDDSAKTYMRLKLDHDTVGNNAPRIFDAAKNSWLQNPRVRFSLTLKDETKCEVQSLTTPVAYSPATGKTPSAIDKRFFGVKETDDKWDSISRFHLESSYRSRDDPTILTQVKLGRANTKKMETDIFYAIDIDDQKKEEGLTFSQVKDFFKNMKIRLAASYNTHMCGRFRLKAVVDVINMRSCGRYTEEVDVSKLAKWPGSTTASVSKQLVWNVSPSSVLPTWIKNPVIKFRQMPGPSAWCEQGAGGNCVTRNAASFGNMAITTVKVGATEPVKATQINKLTALEFATKSNPTDVVARSKEWVPGWESDREADQDKVTKYRYEQDGAGLIAPQLTWFSTLELADLNQGGCKGLGKERQDIEAMISTVLTTGTSDNSGNDASYIKAWYSYLPKDASGNFNPTAETVNTVKDSYVACDYTKGATPGLLDNSKAVCVASPDKLKIRRYTVFSSFHAYALATRKDPQFGQSCLACSTVFSDDDDAREVAEKNACIRSNKVVYRGLASTDPLKARDGCPDVFDAAAYERLRKYLQTFASIGKNGIQMALRPVLHQVDMSLTLQTFDFLDKRQTETTADLLLTEQDVNKYPLIETARSKKISVIPDMDWTVNPKPWNSLDFVGGTKAVTNELVEDGRTGASMGLTMSLPDNLLDGICERQIPYNANGGYDGGDVYQGSTKDGAFAATDAKHCTFLKDTSHKADQRVECPKTGATDTRTQCSLSRQNKDCSPSDGKDNRLSGMQLVMSHYGLLPRAELSHEHRLVEGTP